MSWDLEKKSNGVMDEDQDTDLKYWTLFQKPKVHLSTYFHRKIKVIFWPLLG